MQSMKNQAKALGLVGLGLGSLDWLVEYTLLVLGALYRIVYLNSYTVSLLIGTN